MARAFLTAEWRHLAMLNFAVDPALLSPLVPAGTELDSRQGTTFVSLVGFLFADTRILGVPIPFHRTFEEVNLRFYVRRSIDGEQRSMESESPQPFDSLMMNVGSNERLLIPKRSTIVS